jgi:hypothetical protein
MRKALLFAVAIAWGCSPIDQSGISPSTGFDVDGGAALPDGGVAAVDGGVGGTDGGIAGGGGPDGGMAGPAFDCSGVMPRDLGTAVTVTTPHGSGDICWNATADLSGNVAGEAHLASMGNDWRGTWHVWGTNGSERGSFSGVGGDLFGQREGFQSTQGNQLVLWSPGGQAAHRTPLRSDCSQEAFFSSPGGSLALERCGGKLNAYRFDAQGNRAASATIGQADATAGVIDSQSRVLIVISHGNGYAARWYDSSLAPISAPFDLSPKGKSKPMVRPLIPNGAAIQIDGVWVATARSGVGAAVDPPPWLTSHKNYDLQIIRQRRAYALIPRDSVSPHDTLELYSGAGERCGSVKFPADGLSMGPEGTVIGHAGGGECTHPFWSGLLQ